MPRRYAFIYFLKDRPDRIREVAAYRADYWRNSDVGQYIGGPFADRSGGLISFEASSLGEAQAIVHQDPFVIHALLAHRWIKEWRPAESGDPGAAPASSWAAPQGSREKRSDHG